MKWQYSNTTNTIWTSFDYGVVEAETKEEAEILAKKELEYNLKKVNEVLNCCDPTIGFTIEMNLEQIEILQLT